MKKNPILKRVADLGDCIAIDLPPDLKNLIPVKDGMVIKTETHNHPKAGQHDELAQAEVYRRANDHSHFTSFAHQGMARGVIDKTPVAPPLSNDQKPSLVVPPDSGATNPNSVIGKPSAILESKSNLIGVRSPSRCKIIGNAKPRKKRQVIATIIRQGNISEMGIVEI